MLWLFQSQKVAKKLAWRIKSLDTHQLYHKFCISSIISSSPGTLPPPPPSPCHGPALYNLFSLYLLASFQLIIHLFTVVHKIRLIRLCQTRQEEKSCHWITHKANEDPMTGVSGTAWKLSFENEMGGHWGGERRRRNRERRKETEKIVTSVIWFLIYHPMAKALGNSGPSPWIAKILQCNA